MQNEDAYHPTLQIFLKHEISTLTENEHKRFNFREANYDAINSSILAYDWSFLATLPLNEAIHFFYVKLFPIISQYIPKFALKRRNLSWFNSDVMKLIHKKENSRRKWLKTK